MEQQQTNNLTLSAQALIFATSQLGVCEAKGHQNTGKEVDQYLASVGLPPGNAWCMAFMYWCYQQAAAKLGVKSPLIKTGSVLMQWHSQQPRFKILPQTAERTPTLIKPGSLFILDFGGGKGHTGMVEKFDGKTIHTIEGNSNDDGSRDGYEVCRKPNGRSINASLLAGFLVF